MTKRTSTDELATARARRMQWWHEARFGMFIHWGLYARLARHEWAMNRERIPVKDYEKLADGWNPKPCAARDWARLARDAGMRYMVMTTKHHEGFCLWNSQHTDYNAACRGPNRDLVREYVDACREFGLRVGFYYSLMDWHHPDGARCLKDPAARRRFLAFTQGCVRELCSNYGKIDILWYDVAWPLPDADAWDSRTMNAMVRDLQPGILINNRSHLPEDFGTPEEHIAAEAGDRAWEACMTFNGSWGYHPTPAADWHSARAVLNMLQNVAGSGGNLLLNIGPKADGSIPPEAVDRLQTVGRWLKRNGEAVYGRKDRIAERTEWMATGRWTGNGRIAYFWCSRWTGRELAIGGIRSRLKNATLLSSGKPVDFEQTRDRLVLKGLPPSNPDKTTAITVFKLEFASKPVQKLGAGCVIP